MIDLRLGDCLDILPTLDVQVDAIITDLPYGTTSCKWDVVIPFEPMWKQVKRILKPRGAFVTTASQPFTSLLVCSNLKWYRHRWVWEKSKAANFVTCNSRPLPVAEDIIVFGDGSVDYHPQMENIKPYTRSFIGNQIRESRHKTAPIASPIPDCVTYTQKHPRNVIRFSSVFDGKEHPTQKPVALYEYLIRTYTNEGDTVMDFCMGSGTTGKACVNTGRNFIGIEKDAGYFEVAQREIEKAQMQEVML